VQCLERVDEVQSVPADNKKSNPSEPGPRPDALAKRAIIGAVWTIATSTGSRAVGLVGTILLTHFLMPAIIGEVSIASVAVLTATVVSNIGLSQYIVARPNEGRDAAFHATFYYILLGAIALGTVVLFRGPIAAWMSSPNVAIYIPYLALSTMMDRVSTIQDRILVRDMRFRSIGLQRSLSEIIYAVASCGLAWLGWGASAIIWGSMARSVFRLVTLSFTTSRREWLSPCQITWERTREFFAFGLPMSIATIAGFGSRKWDNLVIGRRFGEETLGIYNYAYQVADIPATQIGETIGDVLVPSFAQMDSNERRKKAFMLSMRILVLIVAPMAVGLGAIAPTLVRTFFTAPWWGVADMLIILSVLSVVRPIGWIGSSYLQVRNRPREIMVLEIAKTFGLLALMVLFQNLYRIADFLGLSQVSEALGLESHASLWSCIAVGLAFGLNSLGFMWVVKRVDGLSLRAQIGPLLPAIVACLPIVLAVLGIRYLFGDRTFPNGIQLTAETLGGALIFIPSALLLAPSASQELLKLLKHALQRRRGRTSEPPPPPADGLIAPGSTPKPPIG
jgi:lipopolysaccharide exporter